MNEEDLPAVIPRSVELEAAYSVIEDPDSAHVLWL
jgi:hypothetical protein